MKFNIPFTKRTVNITKRGVIFQNEFGVPVSFADWSKGWSYTRTTPLLEMIYTSIASEFAKIDWMHIKQTEDNNFNIIKDNLNYLLTLRPNEIQSKYEFMYTMMYQLLKYGNCLALVSRNDNGNVISLSPLNVNDYLMGNGYQTLDGMVFIKLKNKISNEITLAEYNNLIHLRLNPVDLFNGDLFHSNNNTQTIIKLFDEHLNSLINELMDSGTVRGIVTIGKSSGGFNNTLTGEDQKVNKADEIVKRISKNKGGVLVLDAGEEWESISSPFSTVDSGTLEKYLDLLYSFMGVNREVIDGTASYDQMEVFFGKTIYPRIEQMKEEMNYKIFSSTAYTQGHRIEYYRNPFEYMPIDKAIDVAYKGAMDTTTNERRRMIYKLPPIDGGDILMGNKNFETLTSSLAEEGGD